MRKNLLLNALGGIAIVALIASFADVRDAAANDCEFITFMYKRTVDACNAGNADSCSVLPAHQQNFDKCPVPSTEGAGGVTLPLERVEEDTSNIARKKEEDNKDRGSNAIREIQFLLARLGYDPGPVDGLMGKSTCRAISAFSSANKKNFECEYSVGLRDALIEAVSKTGLTEDERHACDQIKQVKSDDVLQIWRGLVESRLAFYQEREADLDAMIEELGNADSRLELQHVSSQLVLMIKGVAKFSVGKAIVLTTLFQQYHASAALLAALTAFEKLESIADIIRGDLEAFLEGEEADVLDTLGKIGKDVADIGKGLEAAYAGIKDGATVLENEDRNAETRTVIRTQIDRVRAQLRKARDQISASQGYRDTLLALEKIKASCAEAELSVEPG